MRAVATGNTLDAALISATGEAREPLLQVFEQVVRDIRLGGGLEEALEEATRTYDLDELRILALAVRVNRKYGSSIQDLLKSVVKLIRRAESARREFKSMTSETRLSAWVLSLLPVLLALYIALTNPLYLDSLLYDPTGRVLLGIAIVLQLIGAFILWRMTRVF
jgi:tight adherence protein B